MISAYASLNGKLIKKEDANLPIDTIELMYGFGVYENLKIRNNKLYFVSDHVKRLFYSAKQIDLKHQFKQKEVEKWIKELISKNKLETANIKMIILGGNEPKLFIFALNPLFVEKKDYRDGVKAITFKYERFAPQAKTLNMLPSYIAYQKAKEADAIDALFIDRNGNITEGTRSNFFAIKGRTLYTPPTELVLSGITRQTVLGCAQKNGYKIIEKEISLKNVFDYDGAFFTNTSGKIVPIKMIDGENFDEICLEIKNLVRLYNEYLASCKL
jgi:D-alanine transaminase/branched-chain amino acid aminotransferase